ncbi:MAG: right-handed parallel beta-helix repeat-containing protein [Bacteroidia bacterium]
MQNHFEKGAPNQNQYAMRGLILFYITLISNVINAQLNGTYTIGGSNPSYANFTAAAAALNTSGISGNVTFNVRPGTYNERINISSVPGNSASRTITFQSENGDSSSVLMVQTSATNANNYVVNVLNTQNVVFKRMSFKAPETGSYNIVFQVYSSSGFKIENARISGISSGTVNNASQDLLQFGGTINTYTVKNCVFRGGYRSIGIYAGSTTPISSGTVQNNRFLYPSAAALRASYNNNLSFTENRIDSCGLSGFAALQITYCSTAVVSRNRIHLNGGAGIQLISVYATNTARSKVNNNFVSVYGSEPGSGGISMQDVRYADVYYNSFNIDVFDSYQITAAQISNSSTNIRVQNNSFVTRPGNDIFNVIGSPNALEVYSHNNVFNGEVQASLPTNSYSLNPGYVSVSDLHVLPATLNAKGIPVDITTDIDGEARSSTSPDIGADEYTPIPLSAGISQVLNPNPDSVYCGSIPVSFRLINSGQSPITQVDYELIWNGNSTILTWNGNLQSGAETEVLAGSFPLIPLAVNDLNIIINSVNQQPDPYAPDNLYFSPELYEALSGSYTLGGANPSFNSFSAAVTRLKYGGICGPVTIKVRNGNYLERIFLEEIKGSSAMNTVTFEGESQDSSLVSITSSGTSDFPSTVRLVGTRCIAFKHMSIVQNASTSNYAAFHSSFGSNITLEHCEVRGFTSSTSSSSDHALVAFPDSNLSIKYSRILGGSGITCNLVGTGPTKYNLIFEHNQVIGGGDEALDARNWTHARIQYNRITGGASNTTYAMYGLGLIDFTISNNFFHAGGAQGSSALYLINNGSGILNIRNKISNNVLTCNLGVDVIAVGMCMRIINTNNTDIYHNTVRHNSADTDNFALNISNSSGLNVKNNIIVNAGLGLALAYNNISNSNSDYNVFYSGGTITGGPNNSIEEVQSITVGDQHSVVSNPVFYSTIPDSMWFTNTALENMGTPLGIITDIYGNPRNAIAPDPGAFELPSAPFVDLGSDTLVCGTFTLNGFSPGADAYLWNTGDTTAAISVSQSGNYVLTASNNLGSNSDTVLITLNTAPEIGIMNDTSICEGSLIDLAGFTNQGQCSWFTSNNELLGNTCQIDSVIAAPIFIFSAENSGCIAYDTLSITIITLPDMPVISQTSGFLYATGEGNITWYLNGALLNGENTDSLEINAAGIYSVMRTNAQGCSRNSEDYTVTITQNRNIHENKYLNVSPNPNTGNAWHISGIDNEVYQYYLVASDGKLMSSGILNNMLYTENLNAGIYRLLIFNNKREQIQQATLIKLND